MNFEAPVLVNQAARIPRLWTVLAATVLLLAELTPVQAGCWFTNAPMIMAREQHTGTRLNDGSVLLVGGTTNRYAEVYDPLTGTSVLTGPMNVARFWDHSAVLLADGSVLVAGGYNDNYTTAYTNAWLNVAEIYDPATQQWSLTGEMVTHRLGQTMTRLTNGQVLVAGGTYLTGGSLANAELYDPNTGVWTATGSLQTHRYHHTATLLTNGLVLVAGGSQGSLPPPYAELASAELYNPGTGTWTNTGSLHIARADHTATLLPDGRVLVAGGGTEIYTAFRESEIYDPATGTWSLAGLLHTPRLGPTSALLTNGLVLIAGGLGTNTHALASMELYDPHPRHLDPWRGHAHQPRQPSGRAAG